MTDQQLHSHHHRALVVDDDQPIRFMLRRVLERMDCQVDMARDGFEAIELLKKTDYDVVFLDMMLPRIDGFGVLRFLKHSAPRFLSRVVIMTAGITESVPERVRGVMTKPFDLEELRMYARQCCAHEGEAHAQATAS